MEWFDAWTFWHWLILGFLLLIAEIIVPGVFLLWWGLAAIIVSMITIIIDLSLTIQCVIYGILAIVLTVVWWKYQHTKDKKDQANSSLNRRDHAMLGCRGKVEVIAENGIGRGVFGDTTWRIQGKGLQQGDIIEVQAVNGITLIVQKK